MEKMENNIRPNLAVFDPRWTVDLVVFTVNLTIAYYRFMGMLQMLYAPTLTLATLPMVY